jgi:hypothetical protein
LCCYCCEMLEVLARLELEVLEQYPEGLPC